MSKFENNPAIGMSWDDYVKETMTPEEISKMKFRTALTGALIEARDAGKITVAELQEIEDIEDLDEWQDRVLKTLFSLGVVFTAALPQQDKAS